MDSDLTRKIYIGCITVIGGIAILYSYVDIIKSQINGTYDYWFGVPKEIRNMIYVFQVFAAIGFVTYIIDLLIRDLPNKGIFKNKYVLPILITLILLFSLLWSLYVQQYAKNKSTLMSYLTPISLVVTAISAILLFAGEFENPEHSKWYNVLGLLFLCIVVVLLDAVGWNANFILKQLQTR